VPEPILVITGPSGAGKTTVGRLVATAFDPSVHIRVDDFLTPFFVNGWIDPRRPESTQQSHVLGGATAAAALALAAGGYTTVFDGHLFPEGLAGLAQMCESHRVPLHYAVLRPDLATCVSRASQRATSPDFQPQAVFADFDISRSEDLQSFAQFHARFADLGEHEGKVIDASAAPERVAQAVLAAFDSGELRVVAPLDQP
jgi:predicted kinase